MQPTTSDKQTPQAHGDVLTAISDGMVALLKEFYGHGPTRTKSYYADDLVVCVLRGGFSQVEETLLQGGRGAAVIQQRMEFQEVMRHRFAGVIEHATGRPVIGFMSGNQQHPDMMCEVFILAPRTLLTSTRSRQMGGRPRRLADPAPRQRQGDGARSWWRCIQLARVVD
jgi:uncharacterized protein YbcI